MLCSQVLLLHSLTLDFVRVTTHFFPLISFLQACTSFTAEHKWRSKLLVAHWQS